MRFLIMAIVLLAAGCTTITGNRTFENHYDQIQKGTSTRQDVIALLGNPNQVTHPDQTHTVLIYEKRKTSHDGWFPMRMKVETERLSVFIDENDVVSEYKMDTTTDDYLPQGGGSTYTAPYQASPSAPTNQIQYIPSSHGYGRY